MIVELFKYEKSDNSIEEAIIKRRTRRCFENKKVTLKEISQILFSAQGSTSLIENKIGYKTAPSAGAIFPLTLYISLTNTEVENGIYKYEDEKIIKVVSGDKRKELLKASQAQNWILKAPITLIICADFNKIQRKYKERGVFFSFIEAGHVAQNVLLQLTSFQMGGVCIGGFDQNKIQRVVGFKNMTSIYLISLGKVSKMYDKKREDKAIEDFRKRIEKLNS